jgi:hypothetical protein
VYEVGVVEHPFGNGSLSSVDMGDTVINYRAMFRSVCNLRDIKEIIGENAGVVK